MKKNILLCALALGLSNTVNAIDYGGINPERLFNSKSWTQALENNWESRKDIEPKFSAALDGQFLNDTVQPLLQQELFAEAITAIEGEMAARKENGSDFSAQFYVMLGNLYLEGGNSEKAIAYYKQAIEDFPNFLRANWTLGQIYYGEGKYEEAIKYTLKALILGDKQDRTYAVLGHMYIMQEKYVSAEAALRQAMMMKPDEKNYKVLLANTLLSQERYAEANAFFEEVISDDPDDSKMWLAQANALMGIEKYEEASKNLEIVRNMGGADLGVYMLLGNIYINRNMLDMATNAYLAALADAEISSADAKSLVSAVESLTNYTSYENAATLSAKIRETITDMDDEQDVKLLGLEAKIALTRGEADKAVPILEQIVDKDPYNGNALITLAGYFAEIIDTEETDANGNAVQIRKPRDEYIAVNYFERAEELDNQQQIQLGALLKHATMLIRKKDFIGALPLLERAQSIKEQDHVREYLIQVKQAAKSQMAKK